MDKRQIKRAAPDLLSAAKSAYKLLLEPDFTDSARQAIMRKLGDAIDIAETDETAHQVEIVVTRAAADSVVSEIASLLAEDPVWFEGEARGTMRLLKQLKDGRYTKRRVYWKLDVDLEMLKVFRGLLGITNPGGRVGSSYDRITEQLDEVISKSPLQYLAETGL